MRRAWSPRRWRVLGGPGGYMSMAQVGDELEGDYRQDWTELARVNIPRSRPFNGNVRVFPGAGFRAVYSAVLRTWELTP